MKVILLADVKGVGKKDQTINASEGYVKNFLFPRKLAVEANSGNLKKLDNQKKAEDLQRQEELDAAKALGEKIAEQKVVIKVKTGDSYKQGNCSSIKGTDRSCCRQKEDFFK